jgi:hypothetical protein
MHFNVFESTWVKFASSIFIATTQPTTQNNLKQLLLGWSYNQ